MVAVCIVVISLTLVSIDMHEDILRKTSLISLSILVLCIGATIAAANPILGLIINIIIIFGIVYQTVENYRSPLYYPFVLSYIFLLMSSPASYIQLPGRLISIVVGSVYILLVQLILNRNRFKKTIIGTRHGMIYNLKNQINNVLNYKDVDKSIKNQMHDLVYTIVKTIDDSKSRRKYITDENKGLLEIALLLEELSNFLVEFNYKDVISEQWKDILIKLNDILDLIEKYYSNSIEDKDTIRNQISLAVDNLSKNEVNGLTKNLTKILKNLSNYLKLTEKRTDKSQWKKDSIIKNSIKKLDIKSFEFKFAIKLSLSVSLVIFFTDMFNITYGRWIVFPMIAIIQPYYDNTLTKAKNRIVGTVIGMILFIILFSMIKSPSARMNLTIIASYIGVFMTKYQYTTSVVAISALGASAMKGGGVDILFYRLIFAIIGCVLAMIVNRYILYYKIKHSIYDLTEEYNSLSSKIRELKNTKEDNYKYNLIIKRRLIEQKIKHRF